MTPADPDYTPVSMPLWVAEDLVRVLDQARDHVSDNGADQPLLHDLHYHAGLHRLRTQRTRTRIDQEISR